MNQHGRSIPASASAAAPTHMRELVDVLSLAFRPHRLHEVAARSSTRAALPVSIVSHWIVLTAPLLGGGLSEPYSNWSEYTQDTFRFVLGWSCLVSGPLAIAINLTHMFRRRGLTSGEPGAVRLCALSAVPLVIPLLALAPAQVVSRSRGQIVGATPSFAAGAGWDFLGSAWWLVAIVLGWLVMIVHASVRKDAPSRGR